MKLNAISVFVLGGVLGATAQEPPNPLDLKSALDLAARENPQIQLARLRTLEAEALALQSRSKLGPQLVASVRGTYQTTNLEGIGLTFPGIPRRVGPYRTFDARPTLTMPVLDLSLLAEYRASRERTKQSLHDAEAVKEQTRLAVIELYLQALQAQSRFTATQARVGTAEAVLKQVGDAEEAGTASKLDIARARQQLEQENTTLEFAGRDRDTLITLLLKTIGMSARNVVALAPVASLPPATQDAGDELIKEALNSRAELRSLSAKERALQFEKQRAEKQRWPTIGFSGDFGAFGQDPNRSLSTYTVAGTLTIPIWTSGRIENEIKAANIRLDQWRQERREQELAIQQEITRAQLERSAAERARAAAERARNASRETLELARLRYTAGMTTNLDVVTAQGNVAQAEEEEIRARYDGLLADARLARARGNVLLFVDGR